MYSVACLFLLVGWFCLTLGVLATRYQWLPFPVGFLLIPLGGLIACVASLLLVWLGLTHQPMVWYHFALAGFAALPMIAMLGLAGKGLRLPPIHDVSTAPGELVYTEAPKLRAPGNNALELDPGRWQRVVALQQQAYGDLQPLLLPGALTADQVYAGAISQAEIMGWKLVGRDAPNRFEAVAQTPLLGFRDDVVVRVGRISGAVRVDVRSSSRLGKSDLGANYARIKAFLHGVEQQFLVP